MKHEEYEAESNISTVTQFVLLGFASLPNLQGILSAVFSIIYMIILIGNCLIILITRLDPTLHKPMYFFLANFSILEICYVSVTVPRILFNIWTQDRTISVLACAVQMCFFLMLGTDECFLLAVMSYDRYVAICNPLQYPLVMNSRKCTQLAAGSWLSGQTCQIFSLHFCNSNEIEHFFCDIPPILKLACGDTAVHELSVYVVVMVVAALPFILVLTSYIKIIATILRLPTAKGRAKAFSTCSSHLLVVVLFYGSATVTYLRPKSMHSPGTDKLDQDKMTSLFYTLVIPMLNPLIYSLRNTDVKEALQKLKMKMCL
ncbi:Olfactory receptor 10AG1 [Lemmus lemmus]